MKKFRDLFPITENKIYVNHASSSPFSIKIKEALNDHIQLRATDPDTAWKNMFQTSQKLRSLFSGIIKADSTDRIAYTQNTTHGLNIIASGLDWKKGDEILIPDNEFPANVYPYKNLERQGVDINFLPTPEGGITPKILRSSINSNTKLLSLSFVEFLSGYKHDLKSIGQICKENDVIFIVDSIQGLGAIPIDVQKYHIDGLANGGHKWLMSPTGIGFLYLTKQLQNKITQSQLGWSGLNDFSNFLDYNRSIKASAKRYELGTLNFDGLIGAHTAISLLQNIGINNIYSHLKQLTTYCLRELKKIGMNIHTNDEIEHRSGIITFYKDNDSKNLFKYLKGNEVVCSFRHKMIRISPHFYNNREEIDRIIQLCQSFPGH